MERKQRTKYLLLIYISVALLAIILLIVAFNRTNDIWQNTLLNLGTELLGAVFTFFFVGYLFSLDELELGDRIERLLKKLENENLVESDKFFRRPSNDYTNLVTNAKGIDLCGVVRTGTIDKNLSVFKDAIRQKIRVRVLVIDRDAELFKIAGARSEGNDTVYYEKKLEMTFQNLSYLINFATTQLSIDFFQVRVLKFPPSFALTIFNYKDEKSKLFVEIYPHHVGWGDPPTFSLDKAIDAKWHAYFEEQFEAMWERGTEYKP